MKIKQNPGSPNKKHHSIFKHIPQNIRGYPRSRKKSSLKSQQSKANKFALLQIQRLCKYLLFVNIFIHDRVSVDVFCLYVDYKTYLSLPMSLCFLTFSMVFPKTAFAFFLSFLFISIYGFNKAS